MAAHESVSIALGKVLDQSGYLQDLRDERSEEAEGRVENLAELVSAAREYETRSPEPSLGGLRRSALAAVRRGRGSRRARRARADDDDAQREGPRVSGRDDRRPRGRAVSAFALDRRRGGARGRAAALLRRHHARAAAARADLGRAAPGVRRIPVERAVAVHRRDSGGADRGSAVHVRRPRTSRSRISAGTPVRQGRIPGQQGARGAAGLRVRGRGSVGPRRASSRDCA